MTKIYIETYGCSLNQSDSEVMAGLLKKADFDIVDTIEDSDVLIINSCTVKGPTENKFFKRLEQIKDNFANKKTIISGCIAQADPERLEGYSLIGPYQITDIVSVVEEVINDNTIVAINDQKSRRLNLPKIRRNNVIEIIPTCAGCLGEPCSYCKVKDARGELLSYDKEEIVKQAKKAIADGVKELWLTAQDTGSYGKDINSSLPELIDEITKINGTFFVRIGMMNPNHAKEMLDELIESYKHPKMFKFLHIPVQSGNDHILRSMRRRYEARDFKEIVDKFRSNINGISISTDIICGFPGETDEQFNDSLNLIKQTKPEVLNISRFWPRPKTEAASMENQITGGDTKKRSQLMTDIFHNISRMNNERWINWKGKILIDEVGKEDSFIGRNLAYKPVVVKGNYRLGDIVEVKVSNVTNFDLRAY